MLKRLSIHNFALIDSIDIEFPTGLIIISGETGAGKSILLGGLSLLLGGKADATQLLNKEKNCVIEGVFNIVNNKELQYGVSQILENEEVDNELIIRRVISANGRSRAFINDIPVSLAAMASISSNLIDIHAQHSTLLLNDSNFQMNILDFFAGSEKELNNYREANNTLAKKRSELELLEKRIVESSKEHDYKLFQLEKLQQANLANGELEELELEQKQLATAEEYKNSLCSAILLLSPQGTSVVQNFKEIKHLLEKHISAHPQLKDFAERFESLRIECKDLEGELESAADDIVISPDRLSAVEDRLNNLYSLMKKSGVTSIEELILLRDQLAAELDNSNSDNDKKVALAAEVEKYTQQRKVAAEKLSDKREKKVKELGKILQERIRQLEMPDAIFTVSLQPASNYTNLGKDEICFMFSANKGIEPAKLQKVASGGELSRIMLCLKWLMAKYTGMPTMIFDEIDTGVSGKIAEKMGILIDELGKNMQVFAITHLPQIASKGDTHVLVYKDKDSDRTTTKLKALTPDERILEIARMLSGEDLSEAAIENAKYLLKKQI